MPVDIKNFISKLQLTDDGIHLDDSVLWFDAYKNRELSFISSAQKHSTSSQTKIIATEETVKIIEHFGQKPNALICQYYRPFSLGRLRMELLPSGSVLGGASLYVEKDQESTLYAPDIQSQAIPTEKPLALKSAHTLILKAHYPDLNVPIDRNLEKERLLKRITEESSRGYPLIFCKAFGTAQEISACLQKENLPISVHKSIYTFHKFYENYGTKVGDFSLLPSSKNNKVLLLPATYNIYKKFSAEFKDRPKFLIEEPSEASSLTGYFPNLQDKFLINQFCDLNSLSPLIASVKPKNLLIFGPYAMRYIAHFKEQIPHVKALYSSDQPLLL